MIGGLQEETNSAATPVFRFGQLFRKSPRFFAIFSATGGDIADPKAAADAEKDSP